MGSPKEGNGSMNKGGTLDGDGLGGWGRNTRQENYTLGARALVSGDPVR